MYLHEGGEEISVCEVGDQSCGVGARDHGQCHLHGF